MDQWPEGTNFLADEVMIFTSFVRRGNKSDAQAEQTRWLQVPVAARSWKFESSGTTFGTSSVNPLVFGVVLNSSKGVTDGSTCKSISVSKTRHLHFHRRVPKDLMHNMTGQRLFSHSERSLYEQQRSKPLLWHHN